MIAAEMTTQQRAARTMRSNHFRPLPLSALAFFVWVAVVSSVRAARRPNLLRAEPDPRKSQKSTVCQLGKNRYDLESVWHPDLGPPFGVMACVVCQCVPVQRKRRVKAKTKCKNIRDECPKPNCPSPVLLPGQCCKLCPGQSIFGNGVQAQASSGTQLDREEDDSDSVDKANKNMFAALLTSRFVPVGDGGSDGGGGVGIGIDNNSPSPAVATARFRFRKKSLHFSLMSVNVGGGGDASQTNATTPTPTPTPTPTALRFLNERGQILEELPLRLNERQRREGIVCGIWRKVPRSYRRLIKEDKMLCVLVFGRRGGSGGNDDTLNQRQAAAAAADNSTGAAGLKLGGRMLRQTGLDTELLSGILHPELKVIGNGSGSGARAELFGAGGMAIVSVDSQTGGLHINTVFAGVMPSSAKYNIPFKLRLVNANANAAGASSDGNKGPPGAASSTADNGGDGSVILEHDFVVDKTSLELNSVVVRSALGVPALRQLARAKLMLEITNQDDSSFKIGGRVSPKDFCSVFCVVLGSTTPPPSPSPAAGGMNEETRSGITAAGGTRAALTTLMKPVTGYGLFDLNKDGSLDYRIRLFNADGGGGGGGGGRVTTLAISKENKENKKKPRVIQDVAARFTNGWANGTITKLNVDDLYSLTNRDVFVEVEVEVGTGTATSRAGARGRVTVEMFNEAHVTGQPLVLGAHWGSEQKAAAAAAADDELESAAVGGGGISSGHDGGGLVGLAWLGADEDCVLHAEVQVAGPGFTSSPSLGAGAGAGPAAPASVELWHRPGKFSSSPARVFEVGKLEAGGRFEGESADDVPNDVLAQIGWGLANLVVVQHRFPNGGNVNVSAWVDPMKVDLPENCLPRGTKVTNALLGGAVQANGRPSSLELLRDETNDNEVDDDFRCVYEARVYMEGEQWAATHARCHMCHCARGRVNCEAEQCPTPACTDPHPHEYPPAAGSGHMSNDTMANCCPTCPQQQQQQQQQQHVAAGRSGKAVEQTDQAATSDRGCSIPGDPVFHPAGSSWHPYVPPNGFDKCVSCTCVGGSLSVDCRRHSCPPLPCHPRLAFKEKVTDCCKRCPEPKTVLATVAAVSAVQQRRRQTVDVSGSERDHEQGHHDQSVDEDKMGESEYRAFVLRNGGCEYQGDVHKNGAEWLLNLRPWGEMKCFPCTCKDGAARCKRKTCPKLDCKDPILVPELDPCCRRCRSDVEGALSRLATSAVLNVGVGTGEGKSKFVASRLMQPSSPSLSLSSPSSDQMQSDEPYQPSSKAKFLEHEAKVRHRRLLSQKLLPANKHEETTSKMKLAGRKLR